MKMKKKWAKKMDLVVSSTTSSIFLELKKILHGILFTILKMRHLYRTRTTTII